MSEEEIAHQLLSNLYLRLCDCRRKYGMSVNMHPLFHSEDCVYRVQIECSDLKEMFNYGRTA